MVKKNKIILIVLLLALVVLVFYSRDKVPYIEDLYPTQKPIKVGVLHSLTGTMAISEKPVVDAVVLAIEELNENGGVLGRKIVPVIADGELSYKIKIKSADEIGQLADSFNKMVESLKTSREELLEATNYTGSIVANMIDSLIVVDTKGNIKTANHATLKLLGYKEEELLGRSVKLILPDSGAGSPFYGARLYSLMDEGVIRDYDMTYKSKGGALIPASFSGSVIRKVETDNAFQLKKEYQPLAKIVGVVGIARDIREFRKLQTQLVQAEKLSGIGQLAGGVAHELNSPLAGLLGLSRTYKK